MAINEYVHIGVQVALAAATIATLKADIKWLGKALEDHKDTDNDKFEEIREDIRDLRRE